VDAGRRLGVGRPGGALLAGGCWELTRVERDGHSGHTAASYSVPNRYPGTQSHAQPHLTSHRDVHAFEDAHEHPDTHAYAARADGHVDLHANATPGPSLQRSACYADVSARNAVSDAGCRNPHQLHYADGDADRPDTYAPGGTA
jgi:hypothetical protein